MYLVRLSWSHYTSSPLFAFYIISWSYMANCSKKCQFRKSCDGICPEIPCPSIYMGFLLSLSSQNRSLLFVLSSHCNNAIILILITHFTKTHNLQTNSIPTFNKPSADLKMLTLKLVDQNKFPCITQQQCSCGRTSRFSMDLPELYKISNQDTKALCWNAAMNT